MHRPGELGVLFLFQKRCDSAQPCLSLDGISDIPTGDFKHPLLVQDPLVRASWSRANYNPCMIDKPTEVDDPHLTMDAMCAT